MNEKFEKSFYKQSIVLLQGAIIELNSKIELIRKYRIADGYRSYHMILQIEMDILGESHMVNAEIQIRTIAMDCWASLEHELKYKKSIENQEMIIGELRRCADEMATT